jgi:hypothetical protein
MAASRRLVHLGVGAFATTAMVMALVPTAAGAAAPTTTTFSIAGGSLVINAPVSASLGSAAPGDSLSAALGTVTVTDTRGALLAAWTATASTTSFSTGAGNAPEIISQSAVSYASGPATANSGLGIPVPGQASTALAAQMTTSVTAFSKLVGVGNNSTAWNPTLIVAVPAAAVAGTYTGTVTHSVA